MQMKQVLVNQMVDRIYRFFRSGEGVRLFTRARPVIGTPALLAYACHSKTQFFILNLLFLSRLGDLFAYLRKHTTWDKTY
jgi:hypothetical protein